MDFWEVVEKRHSVREFEPRAVERAHVERILRAASLAPSPKNSQPWRFHVATGQARAEVGEVMAQTTVHLTEYLETVGPEFFEAIARWYSTLGDAPVAIGVSMEACESDFDRVDELMSMGAALENLLLAATAEGLAACVVTFSRWVCDELKTALGVDSDREFVSLVVVGYPLSPQHGPRMEKRSDVAEWIE